MGDETSFDVYEEMVLMGLMVAETYSMKVRQIYHQGTCMCFIDVRIT